MECPHCHEDVADDNITYRPYCSAICRFRGPTRKESVMRILLAFAFAMAGGVALAAPPPLNASYDFVDPVFGTTVFCDTLEQVKEIAAAPIPNEVFKKYRDLKNATGEPTCANAAFSADVVEVDPIPNMHETGWAFHAWAVQFKAPDGVPLWALYLEHFQEVNT